MRRTDGSFKPAAHAYCGLTETTACGDGTRLPPPAAVGTAARAGAVISLPAQSLNDGMTHRGSAITKRAKESGGSLFVILQGPAEGYGSAHRGRAPGRTHKQAAGGESEILSPNYWTPGCEIRLTEKLRRDNYPPKLRKDNNERAYISH